MHEQLAIHLLKRKAEAIEALKELTRHNILFVNWHMETIQLLNKLFGEDSQEVSEFKKIKFNIKPEESFHDAAKVKGAYVKGLETANEFLRKAEERIAVKPFLGKKASKFKNIGTGSFIALEKFKDETVLLETLLSKDGLTDSINKLPEQDREEIEEIIAEIFDCITDNRSNQKRLDQLKVRLNDSYDKYAASMPALGIIYLILEVLSSV